MKTIEENRIYNEPCLDTLSRIPDNYVDCVITSPPYWQLRDYGYEGQWGLEPTFQEYLEHLWSLMDAIYPKLKDSGTVWVNLGDTYSTQSGSNLGISRGTHRITSGNLVKGKSMPGKCLLLIPHRFAIGCEDRGWIVRNDIIWAKCLGGGLKLYAKTSKGTFPQTIKDLARLKNVELWTGEKWSKVKCFYENKNFKNPLEIVLRSGEKIPCTQEHIFPTQNGFKRAGELKVGDILKSTILPDNNREEDILDNYLVPWFIGLYMAEGSRSGNIIQIASHCKEKERLDNCNKIAKLFNGKCNNYYLKGNTMTINMSGKILNAIIDEFIVGNTAKGKHFSTSFWQRDNKFIEIVLKSYLDGDANYDEKNNRYRLGFTDNKYFVDDLRTICARLNTSIRIKRSIFKNGDKSFNGYRGEIRFEKTKHLNNKFNNEIIAINKSNGRKFWDIEIEDESHLFALASGILTHNCNAMPESVTDRFSKKHEYFFFMVKKEKYYFDLDIIRNNVNIGSVKRKLRGSNNNKYSTGEYSTSSINNLSKEREYKGYDRLNEELSKTKGPNPGDVSDFWDIPTKGTSANHYAAYNEDLIKIPILAGCPEGGVIYDPFMGIGTTAICAIRSNRKFIGSEMSKEYCNIANKNIEPYLLQKTFF